MLPVVGRSEFPSPSVFRQTPSSVIDKLIDACASKNCIDFSMAFDSWFPASSFDIRDLDSVMLYALQQGYAEVVSELLYRGLPLHEDYIDIAIKARHVDILEIFLKNGWNVNKPISELTPPALGTAIQDEEMVKWFLNHGADPNTRCALDLTPLSLAVEFAALDTVKTLFDSGGATNKGSLLHHAVLRKSDDTVDMLALVLEKGTPVNSLQYDGHDYSRGMYCFMGLGTALHKAAELGKVEAVNYLLSRGADTTIRDRRNRTALDYAKDCGHLSIVSSLLRHGTHAY